MTKLRNLVSEITPNKRNDEEEDDDVGSDMILKMIMNKNNKNTHSNSTIKPNYKNLN